MDIEYRRQKIYQFIRVCKPVKLLTGGDLSLYSNLVGIYPPTNRGRLFGRRVPILRIGLLQ